MILVDVDNLFIVRDKVDAKLLVHRIRELRALRKPIQWFGNTFTARVVHAQPDLQDISIIITNKAKDTADHAILAYLHKSPIKTAWIVSNDKALAKAAWYLYPHIHIHPVLYKTSKSITPTFMDRLESVTFRTQSEMGKFLLSIEGFTERYGNISAEKQRGARK